MILEIAQIDIKLGLESDFEQGVANALPIFQGAKGCRGLELRRSVETPSRYHLIVQWDALESHTVEFRNSTAFGKWRELVGHCFENLPRVEHTRQVLQGSFA